ncbi:MAG TPA: TonB family protein [Methylococcaceae bacterium]|nr:TonB family protein [Methylococcaceae bacterium]
MTTSLYRQPGNDRFTLALCIAAALHVLFILGVSFEMPKPAAERPALDITLVRNPAKQAPAKADFLAREDQIGGGLAEKKTDIGGEPSPPPQEEVAPSPVKAEVPEPPEPVKTKPVIAHKIPRIVASTRWADPVEKKQAEPRPRLDMNALQQQIADFSSEYVQAQEKQAKRTRTLYINSVSAHRHVAAAYEKAWQEKIERIGNLNYPDEARRKNLSGSLLLSVSLNRDGTVKDIRVRQSSGFAVLDDAAIRIVRLAAPFAPFPAELREEADVLVINRTWKFFSDSHMATAP